MTQPDPITGRYQKRLNCYLAGTEGVSAAYANNGAGPGAKLVCADWAELVMPKLPLPQVTWLLLTAISVNQPEKLEAPEHGWLVRWLQDGHVWIVAGPVLGTDRREEGDENSSTVSVTFDPRVEVFDRLEWELNGICRGEQFYTIEFEGTLGDE